MSASSASTASCDSIIGKDGLLARGTADRRCRRRSQTLPNNKGIECLAVAPKGLPLAGTLIAISERGARCAPAIITAF